MKKLLALTLLITTSSSFAHTGSDSLLLHDLSFTGQMLIMISIVLSMLAVKNSHV